jgi:hypothetical protein
MNPQKNKKEKRFDDFIADNLSNQFTLLPTTPPASLT